MALTEHFILQGVGIVLKQASLISQAAPAGLCEAVSGWDHPVSSDDGTKASGREPLMGKLFRRT